MMNDKTKTNLVIVGATGLVGSELIRILNHDKYRITVVGRSVDKLQRSFPHPTVDEHMTWADFESESNDMNHHYDVILNLAGSGVSSSPWTPEYKQTMIDSRLNATRMCVQKCKQQQQSQGSNDNDPKKTTRLINASAVSLIDQWEETALEAETFAGTTVTLLRTGVVFDMKEGALPSMITPFRMFVGGPIGTGRQIMSWISTEDVARILAFLIEQHGSEIIVGPVNCTAPNAVSQRDFAKALGKALDRPSFFWTPSFLISLMMGQMGYELVVLGQHVYPEKLINAGFKFKHEKLEEYLDEHVVPK